jgi:Outer membrane lipoprotein carrier protein LolA.
LKKGDPAVIVLVPKNKGLAGMISRIDITLARKAGGIKSILITESEKLSTLLTFTDMQFNRALSNDMFTDVK